MVNLQADNSAMMHRSYESTGDKGVPDTSTGVIHLVQAPATHLRYWMMASMPSGCSFA